MHGNLAVGKTYTLSHIQSVIQKFNLDKYCDYYFIKEPLELIMPLLKKYYEGNTHAISLQASFFIYYFQELNKLQNQFRQEMAREGKFIRPKVVFLDRSLTAGLRIFLPIMESFGVIGELEASMLYSLANELIDVLDLPEKNIYRFVLSAPLSQVWKNIQHRGRDSEKAITKSYLQKINEMHFNWAGLLETKLDSQKMSFCRSQNDLIEKIVKLLTAHHKMPENIDWSITSKPPSEMKQILEKKTNDEECKEAHNKPIKRADTQNTLNMELVYTETDFDEVD